MSGIIGHIVFAVLGARAAESRGCALAAVIRSHTDSYLAGAYLGCDIQTMPEAVCVDTGREVGYGTVPIERSPLTGGPVRPYTFEFEGRRLSPDQVHALYYARAHLTFGWRPDEAHLAVPWEGLPDYFARAARDAVSLHGPDSRPLAYSLGWMAHVIGDSLIKSVQPGLSMRLLDGLYTPSNRPIQDLYDFHRIGRQELGIDWPALLESVAASPVQPIQAHFMRAAPPRGALAEGYPGGWAPDQQRLLLAVLAENRRYLRLYVKSVLADMALQPAAGGWQCRAELSAQAHGLSFEQMMAAAEEARLRGTREFIADAIAKAFGHVARKGVIDTARPPARP